MMSVIICISLFSVCPDDLSIGKSGILKSSTVWGLMCEFRCSSVFVFFSLWTWVPLNLLLELFVSSLDSLNSWSYDRSFRSCVLGSIQVTLICKAFYRIDKFWREDPGSILHIIYIFSMTSGIWVSFVSSKPGMDRARWTEERTCLRLGSRGWQCLG